MPFKFPFAAVLRVRQSIEERDKLALEHIQFEISQVTQMLEQIEAEKAKDVETRELELTSGLPGAHVLAVEADRQRLEQTKKQLEQQLAELRVQRDKQLAVYQESRRKREVFSELHQQQKTAFEIAETRREQKILDDIFIMRLQK